MPRRTTLLIAFSVLLLTLACFRDPRPRPALEFDPAQLPEAEMGVPYEVVITIRENVTPVYWISIAEGTLPDGLTLEYQENDSFAKITGTPTKAGEYKFVIRAACYGTSVDGQTGQAAYTLLVK